jgi:hypothetical protein
MNSMAQHDVAIGKIHKLFVADHDNKRSSEVVASDRPGKWSRVSYSGCV